VVGSGLSATIIAMKYPESAIATRSTENLP
jgi:hypothetical protein